MGRKKYKFSSWSDLYPPIFIVVAFLAIWLSLSYLPLSNWGITFDTDTLWTYMPWLLVFGLGLYGLKRLIWR